MNPNGRLKKFDLLDADWDFNARTIGGFVSGVEKEAIQRRFYAVNEEAELADEERRDLAAIQNLTSGDFRTVRQRNFYLGKIQTNAGLIVALKVECALKKDGVRMPRIGFAA